MNKVQHTRRRAGKPKSKTGCLSCRRRRIKCDERKLGCLRCLKAGFECDYAKPALPRNELRTGSRDILPKGPLNSIPRIREPETLGLESEVEHRYLVHFENKTHTGFAGITDWSVWNHLVLQLSHHEPFVRDSIIAIGALIRSLEAASSSRAPFHCDHNLQGVAKMHKQFALFKYGKAIKSMQVTLTSTEPRRVLIACLLVYCFEILLKNRHLALSHLGTGHRLLHDWMSRVNTPPRNNLLSPAPSTVDDDLVEAFEHLDLQISSIYDVRSIDHHRSILHEGHETINQMPSAFHNLTEAQRYLNAVMRQSYHFVATTWPSSESSTLSRPFSMEPFNDVQVVIGTNIYTTSYKVSPALNAEQAPYSESISRWSQAFEPLRQRTPQTSLLAAMLQVHAIATRIILAGVLFTRETSYDIFLPQFEKLLSLAKIIVSGHHDSNSPSDGAFSLGLGITSPLFLLISRCRDHYLRWEAVDILRKWHPEACWNAKLIAEVGAFCAELEEEGGFDENGIIPEKNRAVFTRICEAPVGRDETQEALIQYVQRRGGADGGPVWRERLIFWK